MHVTNKQLSDKLKMADLLRFFAFYVNNLTRVGAIIFKFNNGVGLLSSVLVFLFQISIVEDSTVVLLSYKMGSPKLFDQMYIKKDKRSTSEPVYILNISVTNQ